MTQTQAVTAETCDQFLRQAREFLAQENSASASAAGWRAAVLALESHTGDAISGGHFRDAARRLVKDHGPGTKAAEWVVSAITLSENVTDDWLDTDGVARRLDDVQRLVLLVEDIAYPPRSAEDILARSRRCLENGYLVVASEKGWEAALLATKSYADAKGIDYNGDGHFALVARFLEKDHSVRSEIGGLVHGAELLRRNGSCSALHPRRLYTEIIAEDIDGVEQLAAVIDRLIADGYKTSASAHV